MEEYEDIVPVGIVSPIEETRGKAYHFYLSGEIGPAAMYTKLLHVLKSCSPNDLVYLHINSPGGRLWSAVQIIHAIGACRGTVITCAEGEVASGASLIFFAGHGMEIGEFASIMAHDARGGGGGTLAEQGQSLEHILDIYRGLCKAIYNPFLSKGEMKTLFGGGTVYLNATQVRERIAAATKKATKGAQK